MLQAEENLHSASALIGVARANRLPSFNLTGDIGSMALAFGNVFSAGNGFRDVGASVTQPIFQGGTLMHKERAARAAYVQANEQYRSTVLSAFQNHDPRNGHAYFNTALFSLPALGTIGDAPRRFFHGPGMQNWDMALLKTTKFTETKSLEFRFEAFNAFNHTQFFGPTTVDGNFNDPILGHLVNADSPRICQAALKLHF